jgi:hypothetical protein
LTHASTRDQTASSLESIDNILLDQAVAATTESKQQPPTHVLHAAAPSADVLIALQPGVGSAGNFSSSANYQSTAMMGNTEHLIMEATPDMKDTSEAVPAESAGITFTKAAEQAASNSFHFSCTGPESAQTAIPAAGAGEIAEAADQQQQGQDVGRQHREQAVVTQNDQRLLSRRIIGSSAALHNVVSSSASLRSRSKKGLPVPSLVALGTVAAAAIAGAVVLWWRRRKNSNGVLDQPIDEEDARFEAEIAAMEAEEKRLAG